MAREIQLVKRTAQSPEAPKHFQSIAEQTHLRSRYVSPEYRHFGDAKAETMSVDQQFHIDQIPWFAAESKENLPLLAAKHLKAALRIAKR